MEANQPLRAKRRRASRRAFIEAARVLFNDPGFEETTMARIADRAGLHLQTLYKHFPTKQVLASTLHSEDFRAALAERKTSTLIFWRDWVRRAAMKEISVAEGASFLQYVTGKKDPKVAGVKAELGTRYIYLLADSIAEDMKLDLATDRRPVLIANMLWGGNIDALYRWSETGGKADLVALVADAAEQVEAIVSTHLEGVKLQNKST
jgi:AcrR family transcriptional regulator